jgi:putative membrane protein
MNSKDRSENDYKEKRLILGLIIVWIWSSINAVDYFAWVMLSIPVLIYVGTFIATHTKFKFTYFAYVLIFIHIVILLIGAKYTYSFNPLFDKIQEIFNLPRNQYDRVGHLALGVVPAIVTREFLLRKGYFKKSKFFYVTIFAFVIALSASWELLEFFATIITNNSAEYMLSTQGDFWDTHWDMVMAIIGAALALVFLGKTHDKWIQSISKK